MKRKELAQLLRKYRNDETIVSVRVGTVLDYYQILLWFKDSLSLPKGATAIQLNSGQDVGQSLVVFSLEVESKK